MKKISRLQLAILWLCIIWLFVVLCPLVGLWMWSGLHPSSLSQKQLDTVMIPARQLRDVQDRHRMERNSYLFQLAPAVFIAAVVLLCVSMRKDPEPQKDSMILPHCPPDPHT